MTALEIAKAFVAERSGSTERPVSAEDAALPGRVREILRTERHTTKSLALRLGRPRDRRLYEVLGKLLEMKVIATDGESCEFYDRKR